MKPFKHAAAVKAVFEKYEVSVEVLGNKKGLNGFLHSLSLNHRLPAKNIKSW